MLPGRAQLLLKNFIYLYGEKNLGLNDQVGKKDGVLLSLHDTACQKSYTSIIMTSITWAGPRYVQELGTFLGPENRTQRRCVWQLINTSILGGSYL